MQHFTDTICNTTKKKKLFCKNHQDQYEWLWLFVNMDQGCENTVLGDSQPLSPWGIYRNALLMAKACCIRGINVCGCSSHIPQ